VENDWLSCIKLVGIPFLKKSLSLNVSKKKPLSSLKTLGEIRVTLFKCLEYVKGTYTPVDPKPLEPLLVLDNSVTSMGSQSSILLIII